MKSEKVIIAQKAVFGVNFKSKTFVRTVAWITLFHNRNIKIGEQVEKVENLT